ncbi:MAG TPA: response regulator [Candidatus Eisenbacteria bacterium]|nr:response regulator [Candidatus Eisenbacteria bacterium]
MASKILIVDDEQNIVDVLRENLERDGYETIEAYDGQAAIDLALSEDPDLILLDCMLPKIDGFDVCRKLRQETSVPIIMLTAKSEEIDKVLGLELGADDYIVKPFSMREVMARVKALLRRTHFSESSQKDTPSVLEYGDLKIDQKAYEITMNDKPINLTLREYELVLFLAKNAGQVFSRETLLEKVWGYEYFGDVRTVDVTVRRTREKLEPNPDKYHYLLTKRGIGYYFNREAEKQ